MTPQITNLPWFKKVSITLRIHARDKRLFDIDNIAAVHLKFFLDALVELERIEEDNYIFVPETHTYFVAIDKLNPRVDIHIKEIK